MNHLLRTVGRLIESFGVSNEDSPQVKRHKNILVVLWVLGLSFHFPWAIYLSSVSTPAAIALFVGFGLLCIVAVAFWRVKPKRTEPFVVLTSAVFLCQPIVQCILQGGIVNCIFRIQIDLLLPILPLLLFKQKLLMVPYFAVITIGIILVSAFNAELEEAFLRRSHWYRVSLMSREQMAAHLAAHTLYQLLLTFCGGCYIVHLWEKDQRTMLMELKETRAKTMFFARVSHEIRTPLVGIIGMAETLLESNLPTEFREDVGVVYSSGTYLLAMLNDIIDYEKLATGNVVLEILPMRLSNIVKEVINLFQQKAQRKRISLSAHLPEMPDQILGDPVRVQQVLMNLVSNACKFTEQGSIKVTVTIENASDVAWMVPISAQNSPMTNSSDNLVANFVSHRNSIHPLTNSTPNHAPRTHPEAEASSTTLTGTSRQSSYRMDDAVSAVTWKHSQIVVVSVIDTGPGIAAKDQPKLFRFFSQVDDTIARVYGGSGLGLAICKQLVTLMGGAIGVRSQLGEGATFWFAFPLVNPAAAVATAVVHPGGKLHPTSDPHPHHLGTTSSKLLPSHESITSVRSPEMGCIGTDLSNGSQPPPPPPPPSSHHSHHHHPHPARLSCETRPPVRVLLVEDNEISQRVAARMLSTLNSTVECTDNGSVAIDILRRASVPFHLILMDWQMPVMDGIVATKLIRSELHMESIPIVGLTASVLKGDREICVAAGMTDVVSKPFTKAMLKSVLDRWVLTASPMLCPPPSPSVDSWNEDENHATATATAPTSVCGVTNSDVMAPSTSSPQLASTSYAPHVLASMPPSATTSSTALPTHHTIQTHTTAGAGNHSTLSVSGSSNNVFASPPPLINCYQSQPHTFSSAMMPHCPHSNSQVINTVPSSSGCTSPLPPRSSLAGSRSPSGSTLINVLTDPATPRSMHRN